MGGTDVVKRCAAVAFVGAARENVVRLAQMEASRPWAQVAVKVGRLWKLSKAITRREFPSTLWPYA